MDGGAGGEMEMILGGSGLAAEAEQLQAEESMFIKMEKGSERGSICLS